MATGQQTNAALIDPADDGASLAACFESEFWASPLEWPDDRDGFTFLANAVLEVAATARSEVTKPERMAWAARMITNACANGDIASRFRYRPSGRWANAPGEAWERWIEPKITMASGYRLAMGSELYDLFSQCALPEDSDEIRRVFIHREGLARLIGRIVAAAPLASGGDEAWRVRPAEAQSAWILRPEARAEAERRRDGKSSNALARAYESMAKPERPSWKAATIASAMRTSGQFAKIIRPKANVIRIPMSR